MTMVQAVEENVYDLVYECGPVAQKFHADKTSRVKLLIGPFGTGKTSSCAYDTIEMQSDRVLPIRGIKRSRFAVVRNTYPELKDTTIKTYFDWFPEHVFGIYSKTEKKYTVKYDGKEIEILFRALDNPDDVKNLLSLELTGAHVDECREIHEDIIKVLLGRIGRYPSMKDTGGVNPFLSPPQLDLSSNYPSTEHWMYRDFVKAPVDGYAIYEQGQLENKHNLRPNYYEDLERDYANRPDLLRTLVRGTWGVTVRGKQVYPTEFQRHRHVARMSMVPHEVTIIIVGWDNTGLSPAISLSHISNTGQWRIFHEFCFDDTGIQDATEAFIIWSNLNLHADCTYRHIGDPAGKNRDSVKKSPAMYIAEKAIDYGKTIEIEDGLQTFKIRRESVANRLVKTINGEPAVLIDPSCTRIIDGFEGGYAYPEIGNSGVYRSDPIKNMYSHIHDSLQYVATRLFRIADTEQEDQSVTELMVNYGGREWAGG